MRHNRKHNLFGWLAASALLLTTACANDAMLDLSQGSGTRTVALTVLPQTQTNTTRGIETGNSTISKGKGIDVLIYAVYEYNETTKTYVLAEGFGKGSKINDFAVGSGQTAVAATGSAMTDTPVEVQLTVDLEKKYKVVFWAQSSQCKAYDTKDLTKVQVSYTTKANGKDVPAPNNDEQRDAFCAVAEIIQGTPANEGKVYLRRPLAQVNVGVAGWDYEGAAYLKPTAVSYAKSKITLNGVATEYNVLEEKAGGELTNATFEYNRLPAFINVVDTEWDKPQITPYTGKDSEGNDDSKGVEEYLKIDLDNDKSYADYVGWKAFDQYRTDVKTKDKNEEYPEYPATETFKYLSMCYVLVPEAGAITDIDKVHYGSVLGSVEFETKGVEITQTDEKGNTTYGDDVTLKDAITVTNVPVQKNWRTNILGYNFFLGTQKYIIDIVPDYCGDYNDDEVVKGEWPKKTKTVKVMKVVNTHNIKFTSNGKKDDTANFFTIKGNTHNKYASTDNDITGTVSVDPKYEGNTFTHGLKMNSEGSIEYSSTYRTKTIIVQSTWYNSAAVSETGHLNVTITSEDGEENVELTPLTVLNDADNAGVYVYILENKPAGSYKISRTNHESGILYVKVQELKEEEMVVSDIDDDTIDDHDKTFDDNYPSYRDKDGDDASANKSTGGDNTPTEGE